MTDPSADTPNQPPLPNPSLSAQYGPGASAYEQTLLEAWKLNWDTAAKLAKQKRWSDVIELLERCIAARADFSKSYVPLSRAHAHMGDRDAASAVLHRGLVSCAARGSSRPILDELRKLESSSAGMGDAEASDEIAEGVKQAAAAAAAAAEPEQSAAPPMVVERQSSLPSAAGASLLNAGFVREGWAWRHEATGTLVIEADTEDGAPEVYNQSLQQSDIDERVALTFGLDGWDETFGSRLLRWVENAIVQDHAAGDESTADATEDEREASKVDVGLSKLLTPAELGATADRVLKIYTWGDKVVSKHNLEQETGCTTHFNAKPLDGRGGGADLKLNATQDPRIVRNVCSSMMHNEGMLWLKRIVHEIERADLHSISIFCSQGRHRSVSAALILKSRYYPNADFVPLSMR